MKEKKNNEVSTVKNELVTFIDKYDLRGNLLMMTYLNEFSKTVTYIKSMDASIKKNGMTYYEETARGYKLVRNPMIGDRAKYSANLMKLVQQIIKLLQTDIVPKEDAEQITFEFKEVAGKIDVDNQLY